MEVKLSEEEFRTILKGLKNTYPADWFIPNEDAAKTWYRLLMDIPYRALSLGATKYMQSSPKEPTPADIRKAAMEFVPKEEPQLTEQEAWMLVRHAVENSGYHSEEEFDKLPEVVQKAVVSPRNLEIWGMMDEDDFNTVQQSQFLRTFRAVQQRQQELDQLSPAVRSHMQIAMNVFEQARIAKKEAAALPPPEEKEERKVSAIPKDVEERWEAIKRGWHIPQEGGEKDADHTSGVHQSADEGIQKR